MSTKTINTIEAIRVFHTYHSKGKHELLHLYDDVFNMNTGGQFLTVITTETGRNDPVDVEFQSSVDLTDEQIVNYMLIAVRNICQLDSYSRGVITVHDGQLVGEDLDYKSIAIVLARMLYYDWKVLEYIM